MTEPESIEPPARLQERVVESLRARALLRAPRSVLAPRWAWPVAIAAGLLLFAGGWAVGRRTAPEPGAGPAAGLRHYTLLLYEGPRFNVGGTPEAALVREYTAWAHGLAGKGRLVAGEKLGTNEWTLGDQSETSSGPTGFFVIAAIGDDEALAIARTCPHLRYGGTVSVRPIDAT
jgi:hypothetical protein